MELKFILTICVTIGFMCNVDCARIYIGHTPPTIKFSPSEGLRLSEVADVIAGSLGYTTISTWPGLSVTSPFGYPLAFVLVNIKSNAHDVKIGGQMYNIKQESSVKSLYEFVRRKLNAQSERAVSFHDIALSDSLAELKQALISNPVTLDQNILEDDNFIHQMEILPSLMEKIENSSSVRHGGQDIIFVEIESYNPLITKYGVNSSEVKEADTMLLKSLSLLEENVMKFYGDRVVFASLFTDYTHHLGKRATTFTDKKEDLDDVNLAKPYSEDFPVVFNIVLFLSIILVLAIIAAASSMALMDPGHDSIIYRMTNPRMKKD